MGIFVGHFPLCGAQYGFPKDRSCTSKLLIFLDKMLAILVNQKVPEVSYPDFSKDFESVSHQLLMHQLNMCGVPGKLHH